MRKTTCFLVAVAMASSALVVVAAPASAETKVLRVEGENRNRDAGMCSTDGERMRTSGAGLEYPDSRGGCWAEWDINLPGAGTKFIVFGSTGGGPSETAHWIVAAGGAPVGSGVTEDKTSTQTPSVYTVGGTVNVAAGSVTIRITLKSVDGPIWQNAWIDYFEITYGIDPCDGKTNRAPPAPSISGADGFGDGSYGWTAVSYVFEGQAGGADPDGDPVSYVLRSSDGRTANGLRSALSFASAGAKSLTLVAVDDPTGRASCLTALSASSAPFTFRVVEDWDAFLDAPEDGTGCVANTETPTVGVNYIIVSCKVAGHPDTQGAPLSTVARASFRVDGDEVKSDTSSPYGFTLRTTDVGPGQHELDVCFYAKLDKTGQEFCSEAYEFFAV